MTQELASGIVSSTVDPKRKREIFARGIECFNRAQFFESHEVLEEIWLAEAPDEKPFYQGLIQVAAGFHHYQKDNPSGAYSLLRQGLEKLAPYPPDYRGVNLASLRADLAPWLDALARSERCALPLPQIRPAS